MFGRELADVIDFRDLADEPLVAQFIEGMEDPLRIPEHGPDHAILIELADVVHARFRELAVQNKSKGCHGNLTIGEADFGPVGFDNPSRGKSVHRCV